MKNVTAIGFDLFNTLITVEPRTMPDALDNLIRSLKGDGLSIDEESFKKAYRESALRFIERARQDGKETHNSLWIASALEEIGEYVAPDDPLISKAVEEYFTAFYDSCRLIPGTIEMLETIQRLYPIGLLSNFTHGPAARKILEITGLDSCFKTILISGELGYRKPHPLVFRVLAENLGVDKERLAYIGDDPEADIHGAEKAGLLPVWTTYARENNAPMAPGRDRDNERTPGQGVPRISSWQKMFNLLDITG
jgi:putative hydrolase of the HAD superfamily